LALALTIEAKALRTAGGTELIARKRPVRELTIAATGRDAERCGRTRNNMIFETYRDVLEGAGRARASRSICGFTMRFRWVWVRIERAARLGGVMLANRLGGLGWDLGGCIDEATRREGHPDNVSACALGYVTVSVVAGDSDRSVSSATCGQGVGVEAAAGAPTVSLATEKARSDAAR